MTIKLVNLPYSKEIPVMHKFSLIILLLFCLNLQSQEYVYPDLKIEEIFLEKIDPTPEMLKFVNGREEKRVLNFDRKVLQYPDTIRNPEKIRFVSIPFSSNSELSKDLEALEVFPNLKYLEIKTDSHFRKSDVKDTLEIPENIRDLKQLKYLQLTGSYTMNYNQLFEKLAGIQGLEYLGLGFILETTRIPDSFLKLKQLKGVKLPGFKEFRFPEDLSSLDNLETVVMLTEQYENINREFHKLSTLPNLKKLSFNFPVFTNNNAKAFSKFRELEELYLRNLKIDSLQQFIDAFPENNQLKVLDLSISNESFIENYSSLKNLEILEIRSRFNFPLDNSLYDLRNLKKLKINTKKLEYLDERLGNLQDLEELNLQYNTLKKLPKSIGKLSKLKVLNLRNNQITHLPEEIENLSRLETLQVSDNQLSSLPDGIKNFTNLKKLYAGRNELEQLPEEIGALQKLVDMYIPSNNLKELPATITRLENLENLKLQVNYLEKLPVDFGRLTNLKNLVLDDNFISELPESISELKQLENLELRFNSLETLPKNFGDLQSLEKLVLGGNRKNKRPVKSTEDSLRPERSFNEIKYLPKSFERLANLKVLDLEYMWSLEEDSLFNILFNLKSKKYLLNLNGAGIETLPEEGWSSFYANRLSLNGNVLENIPAKIVNAPYLSSLSFRLDRDDGLSYNFKNKQELLAYYEEKGFIDFKELPKNTEMAKAYLENAYNRKYVKDKKNILGIMNKAFLLDSTYTAKNIRKDEYADANLEAGNYNKAITYYTKAIQQDTASNIKFINSIVPQFENRSKAYLAIGDTLSAIKDLEIVSEQFHTNNWAKAALLAKQIDKDSLAEKYFNKGIRFYKNTIKENENRDRVEYAYQLSLLEIYILKEDFQKASDYFQELENLKPEMTLTNKTLLEYLGLVVKLAENENVTAEIQEFQKKIKNKEISFKSWSFELLLSWLKQAEIKKDRIESIKSITIFLVAFK